MKKNSTLIGRELEISSIAQSLTKTEPQLIVISGRRRVGKTFLINEYFQNNFCFKLTGLYDKPMTDQLAAFSDEYERRTRKDISRGLTWRKAFNYLRAYLETLPANKKLVVFFDEMPWMATKKSGFLSMFEHFWNDYGSAKHNLVFVVCGSSATWISDKIDKNKGGLFQRTTLRLKIEPWTLGQCEAYLRANGFLWSRYDICTAYMVLGGIPYYFQKLDPSQSLGENIDRFFFNKGASLTDEYKIALATLFEDDPKSTMILESLSKKKKGLTFSEIASVCEMEEGGHLSDKINKLISSGFVKEREFFDGRKRTLYQLSDYFTLFYLRFVRGKSLGEHFWSSSYENPSIAAWQGLTFQSLCFDHVSQIKRALGISGVVTRVYEFSVQGKGEEKGAQIDMVIDRNDGISTLVEIKFSRGEYQITKDMSADIANKAAVFRKYAKRRTSIQTCLIAPFGLANGMYASTANKQLSLDHLFADE